MEYEQAIEIDKINEIGDAVIYMLEKKGYSPTEAFIPLLVLVESIIIKYGISQQEVDKCKRMFKEKH